MQLHGLETPLRCMARLQAAMPHCMHREPRKPQTADCCGVLRCLKASEHAFCSSRRPSLSMQPHADRLPVQPCVPRRSSTFNTQQARSGSGDCRYAAYACTPSVFASTSAALLFASYCCSVVLFYCLANKTFRQLRDRPYR